MDFAASARQVRAQRGRMLRRSGRVVVVAEAEDDVVVVGPWAAEKGCTRDRAVRKSVLNLILRAGWW
jgi:hypothetical protein